MKERTRKSKPSMGMLMVDVKDVAAACSIGVSTVWRLVKSDPTFPQPVYFGPKVARFKVEDVRRWVKQLEAGKPTEDPLAA